ncbi:hypothetical protein [Plantactinospora sp. WMMB782]|uniref:hypothetical protein n=1 Tax=Plantactinospora sp. WMMB782 TaxID=3404121 RepID=UPI003B940E45
MEIDAREALVLSGHLDVAADGPPLPAEVVRTRLVETIRLHRMIGGLCQACGERAGPEGRCFKAAIAVEWCRQNPTTSLDQSVPGIVESDRRGNDGPTPRPRAAATRPGGTGE